MFFYALLKIGTGFACTISTCKNFVSHWGVVEEKLGEYLMDNTSYIALSRQMALWKQMNIVSNNMANMNTVGYKQDNALFTSYVNIGDVVATIA